LARIAKDPEERKSELVEAAEELFATKGFENTLVSDIVRKLGVAQGTFYYYFKSKDEVMAAILDKVWYEFSTGISELSKETCFNPLQKLQKVFLNLFANNNAGEGKLKIFSNIKDESIAVKFHNYSDGARTRYFGPIIQKLVNEGIKAGMFKSMQHPDEITEIIFMGVSTYMHTYSPNFTDYEFFKRKMAALEEMFEIILGVQKGSFKLSN
jgi:AcrR family transcriptional regulator